MAVNSSIFVADTEIAVAETAGQVVERVERTGSLAGDVTITYGVTGDSATAGLDFKGGFGTVVMPSGASEVTVPIQLYDDTLGEPTETFAFSIVNVSAGTLWAPRTSRVSILDDETPAPKQAPEPPLTSAYVVNPVTVASGLDQPIRMVSSPLDGNRMFVAEKTGSILLTDITTGQSSTFLDIHDQVNEHGDRGLLSIALHPDFVHNPYVYAYVVMDPPDGAGLSANAGPDGAGNRYAQLLRFTADAATNFTTVLPGSEKVLLGAAGQSLGDISGGGWLDYTDPGQANQPASDRVINNAATTPPVVVNGIKQDYLKVDSSSHAGGALAFGPDGALYVSTGDGTSFDFADPRTVDVQSLDSLSGKILRIDPMTGQGLPTNPFVTDGLSLDSDRAKIFQYGLRNPFSITFDQEGKLMATDTGWNNWEELNTGGPGTNFGWPFYEGQDGGVSRQTAGYQDTAAAKAFYGAVANGTVKVMAPFRAFSHDSGDPGFQVQAVTGSEAIYSGSVYPASFNNQWIFEDFAEGHIFAVNVNDRSQVQYLYSAPSGYAPVDFVQAPNGYIYAADIALGQIERLEISAAPAGGNGGGGAGFPPAAVTLGNGAHALVLMLSQDAYQGSAQYTVSVDGVQVGGTQTASALHGSGQDDTVTVQGDWGAGSHTLTVSFLNDAYGGSATTDRNLYVDGVSYDGAALANGTAALMGPESKGFVFTGTAPQVPAPAVISLGNGAHALVLKLSQDAYQGAAQYTVSVDGAQIGGTQAAVALHGSGQDDTLTLRGDWAAGNHTVTVTFLNDAYGGTPSTDRNLYVDGVSYDGTALANGTAALLSTGPQGFGFSVASAPPTSGPASVTLGSGAHALVLKISQDAYQGAAQYTVSVDGAQVGGTQAAAALHGGGQDDTVTVKGDWTPGSHTVAVTFLNDAYGGTPSTDRNLYVDGISLDGTTQANGTAALLSSGTQPFGFQVAAAPGVVLGSGAHALVLGLNQDAWQGNAQYTVSVDGVQLGGTQTASALHASGTTDQVTLRGDWAPGPHVVTVNFLNDEYGGTPTTDRNLYVVGASFDGAAVPGAAKALLSAGPQDVLFSGGGANTSLGSGPHSLVLQLSQDAWQGSAQYTVKVDGTQLGGTQTAGALHGFGQEDLLTLHGSWGAGQHVVTVTFLNDAYGNTPDTDRNLYVDAISYDGTTQANGSAALLSGGPHDFIFA